VRSCDCLTIPQGQTRRSDPDQRLEKSFSCTFCLFARLAGAPRQDRLTARAVKLGRSCGKLGVHHGC
jgi:hypothetical protein